MKATTTRRALIAGAAALPALAVPAGAAPIGEISFPDLAARFASVYARWSAQVKIGDKSLAAFNAKVEAVTGIASKNAPSMDDDPTGYWEIREALAKDPDLHRDDGPLDEHGCSIVWNEIHGEMYPLIREILRQPARSLADLALQAQAFALAQNQHWTEETDDNEIFEIRAVIESVCKFCGVDPLPGIEIVQFDPATAA
jgi:hypothetical protein